MAKVLFVRETMLDYGTQLSTNHLCHAAEKLGHDVLWVTRPATPLTLANALRSATARHRVRLAAASVVGKAGRQFCFFTPVIRKKQLGLTGEALLRHTVDLAVPSIPRALRTRGWKEADILWFSDPQLVQLLDRVPHRTLVFQVTDDYSKFANFAADLEGALRRALAAADAVLFTNRALLEDYVARFGIPRERCTYLSHGMGPYFTREVPPPDARVEVVYVGALNDWIDWDLLGSLKARLPGLRLDFFGQATQQVRRKLEALGSYKGFLPRNRVAETLPGYHYGIIPFRRSGLKAFSEPMKLFDYLGAGLPVLSFIDIEPGLRTRFANGIAVAGEPDGALAFLARSPESYAALRRHHGAEAARFAAENSWEQRFAQALAFACARRAGETPHDCIHRPEGRVRPMLAPQSGSTEPIL